MEGDLQNDLIPNGVLISKAGVVDAVGHLNDDILARIPEGATVIDAQGGKCAMQSTTDQFSSTDALL